MLKTVDNLKIYLIILNLKFKFIGHDDKFDHEQLNDCEKWPQYPKVL